MNANEQLDYLKESVNSEINKCRPRLDACMQGVLNEFGARRLCASGSNLKKMTECLFDHYRSLQIYFVDLVNSSVQSHMISFLDVSRFEIKHFFNSYIDIWEKEAKELMNVYLQLAPCGACVDMDDKIKSFFYDLKLSMENNIDLI